MKSTRMNEEIFSENYANHELLKAPNRKRRPPGLEPRRERRVVKMTWDVDKKSTSDLLDEMGVSMLGEKATETTKPTPEMPPQTDEPMPPGAPKALGSTQYAQPMNISYDGFLSRTNPVSHLNFMMDGPSGTFLCKRHTNLTYEDHTLKLSDEMILSIFQWLPKIVLVRSARVCKRWYTLALDETLWRRLDLANRALKVGVIGRVLDRGVAVLRLAKSEIKTPIYKDLPSSQFRISKVQYLDLSMSVVSIEGLEEMLSTCRLLRKLSLENCEINDAICRSIGQNVNLEVLNLCMCQGLTENGLVPICNSLQRLDALNVAWTGMSRGALVYLVICLPASLTKLNLSGCRDAFLDEDVLQLCRSCPHLKELDLSDATQLTSKTVEYVATMLRGLEYIALSRCYHIAPSSLPYLGHIESLLALDVFGMLKESALYQLREAMPDIEINKFPFSSIARPTTGIKRTSIWGLRVRENVF